MQDVSKIVQVKEAAEADLLKRPGVTAVDVGYKYVGGKKTGEIAIRVHVAKKKDVSPDQKIPETIDGVKTDVLENEFVLQAVSMPETGIGDIHPEADANTYDPLLGGISIGPCRAVNNSIYAGTMGAIVLDNASNTRFMLSNFHVICIDNGWKVGDTMAQPSRVDGGSCPNNVVGTLERTSLGGQVDCAVAAITARSHINEITDIGCVTGTADAALGIAVRKRGRTTGLTFGTVEGISLTTTIDYGDGLGKVTLTNQISINVDTNHSTQFSDHGDSGSVVVNDAGQVVGLLFAGNTTGTTSMANPIQSVLTALNVSMGIMGIGGYDLRSTIDQAFAFDYNSSGKLDHPALYRPGTGTIWILKNTNGQFAAVYAQGAPGNGIGGYDLADPADRVFAFDYDGSGKLDHLALYRPGTGTMWILKNTNGQFSPVYAQGSPGNGIGGYDLKSTADLAFAFGYDCSGKLDHLALSRPATGTLLIIKNTN